MPKRVAEDEANEVPARRQDRQPQEGTLRIDELRQDVPELLGAGAGCGARDLEVPESQNKDGDRDDKGLPPVVPVAFFRHMLRSLGDDGDDAPGSSMKVVLTVTEGPHQGRKFEYQDHDTLVVGRSKDAQFRLPFRDKALSRIHFMIEVSPPYCRLMDMASLNGTRVNGQRVTTCDLRDGDLIKGGKTVIKVAIGRAEPRAPSATALELDPTLASGGAPSVPGYVVERELGRGGMGVVYLARDESDGTTVALKTIVPAVAGSSPALGRFLREAGILRQLDHPNIVRFRKIGQAEGRLFFVMEYVSGGDAGALLRQHGGPFPVGRAVGWACQVLDALSYSHALGFVHRDIKPANLLVDTQGGSDVVKLTDFGLARIYHNSPLSGLTVAGYVGGTPAFMAPEQILNFREAKPPVDQYGLAATLYFLISGARVFDLPPNDIPKQLMTVLEAKPVPIRARRPGIPEGLARVIDRALRKDPSARYPDSAAMRKALEPFLSS